jgi:hypothetical protein
MKLLITAIVSMGFIHTAQAAIQNIDCKFIDVSNTDHIIVTLAADQTGTFFYSTDQDDGASTTSSGKLILKRAKPTANGLASFMAQVVIPEGSGSVQFIFDYPEASLMKAQETVKAQLTTEIFGITTADTQDLICSSKLN